MGGRREVQGLFGAFELCFIDFFLVVGFRATAKISVNIVILLLFDSNRPNFDQGVMYFFNSRFIFSVFSLRLLSI